MLRFFRAHRRPLVVILCLVILGAAVCAALVLSGAGPFGAAPLDAAAFARNLGPGWNLGNTLDAHEKGFYSDDMQDYERLWLNPPAEEALFRAVYGAGFKTVRIPVTWYPHMDAAHQVDGAWMQRVRQVVDDALAAGLYVVVNAHHEDWYAPWPENMDYAAERLAALWGQVAEAFAGYDERLVFEGMNEPRLVGHEAEWTCGTPEARDGIDRLNRVFVEAVRAAGGQNAGRYLLVPTYCAAWGQEVCAGFSPPQDDGVIVSLHIYQPFPFTHEADAPGEWTADVPEHTEELDGIFEGIQQHFTSQGVPVAITEFGAIDKDNRQARAEWAGYLAGQAAARGIPCMWWDNGAGEQPGPRHTFALIERTGLEWHYPDIAAAVVDAYA